MDFEIKEIKNMNKYVRNLFPDKFIYYKRKGKYAECQCSECGARYVLRAIAPEDPFEAAAMDIEKPERHKETRCRSCKTKALYKPLGDDKRLYRWRYILSGQKITDESFAMIVIYATQQAKAGHETVYTHHIDEVAILEKGKKPEWFTKWSEGWRKGGRKLQASYVNHPQFFREAKKTGMFKYIPDPEAIMSSYWEDCWTMDFYIAAARYPDMEMLIKMGLEDYWKKLVYGEPVNINPRGKTIEDRLRIRKDRVKDLVEAKGNCKKLQIYQWERRNGHKWTDEEIQIVETLRDTTIGEGYKFPLKYTTPTRLMHYMKKQKMWPGKTKNNYQRERRKTDARGIYYDYVQMKASQGYEMNDINLFPKDFRRRHDEMVLEAEKEKMDKRKKEVLERFKRVKRKYKSLSDRYSAAAGELIIRPAKDAAEIVEEGRLLHHCVGGDTYLRKHDSGMSTILFLRKAEKKDIPYITVEIRDEEVIQWYGAYDQKPDKTLIDSWLKAYTKELTKRKKQKAKNCTGATTRRTA